MTESVIPLIAVLKKLKDEALKMKQMHTNLLERNKEVYKLGNRMKETNDIMKISKGLQSIDS
jgi:hypothetical protein